MPPTPASDLDRAVDGLGDGYGSVAADLEAIRAALDRVRGDFRAITDAAGGKRGTDSG